MSHEHDQLRATIELDGHSGKFELGEDGYTRFVPSKDERKKIESWLPEEIARAREDLKPVFAEMTENVETYKAVKIQIEGSGESILPSPIARNPADQIIASTVNKVVKSKPILSIDPHFPAKYKVAVPATIDPNDPETAQMAMQMGLTAPQTFPTAIEKDAEDIAFGFEKGMEFKLRERLNFIKYFHELVYGCVVPGLVWSKVYREKRRRPLIAPKVKGAFLDLANKEEKSVAYGEEVHFCTVPYPNVLRPNLDDEIDDLPWIAELTPKRPDEITAGYKSEEYFLIDSEEEAKKLSKDVCDAIPEEKKQTDATTKNVAPQQPRQMCDVMEVWFYRNLKVVDPETGEKTVKRFSLMGEFHCGAKRLLSCYRNPYDHQQRIHVPSTQFLDGSCTVGTVKWHQRTVTHAINSEIKNAWHANNYSYRASPGSDIAEKYADRPLTPGRVIVADKDELEAFRPGSEHASLLPLVQYIEADAQAASRVSDFEMGSSIPGRTPSSTVQQILEKGGEPGNLFLLRLNEGIQRVMRLYLATARQFQPMGEGLKMIDPETRAIMEVPFRFPVEEVLDNFRISLTAADEALAKERAPEEIVMQMQTYQTHAQFVASIAGPMMDPNASPATVEFFRKLIEGEQAIFERLMKMSRTDAEDYDINPAVEALVQEKQMMLQQMQMQQEMGMNADQSAEAGGAVPPEEGGGDAGGSAGATGEPGMEMGAPPDATAAGLPAEAPPL